MSAVHGNSDSDENYDNLLTVRLSKLLDSPCPGGPRMSAVPGNGDSDKN